MGLNKSPIEWTDYTWNPVSGCWGPGGSRKRPKWCPFCYARKIATRFKGTKAHPNGFLPTFHPEILLDPFKLKKLNMIFTCSMGDLFGKWVPDKCIMSVLSSIENNPHHIFQILTKSPENLMKWKRFFPSNLWLGVSVCRQEDIGRIFFLSMIDPAVRFISFEPLLGPISVNLDRIDWIIIGAQTNPLRIPKEEWAGALISQTRDLDIPIFIKDNLHWPEKIREFPES